MNGRCEYGAVPGCCSSRHQCGDDDPCTADQCDSLGQCVHTPIKSCCTSDADCENSENICTAARCSLADGRCVSEPDPDCCTGDESCPPAGACVLRVCSEGSCASVTLPLCCQADLDCDDADPCTVDACDPNTLQCNNSREENCCRTDSDCTSSLSCVDAICDGDPGQCQEVPVTTCCEVDSDCESPNPCMSATCEQGRCAQEPVSGCCFVKEDCTLGDACQSHECSDFACTPQHIPGCCLEDSGCDDGDPCTDDRCDDRTQTCTFVRTPGCCISAADCEDGNPCTEEQCIGEQCQYSQPDEACCSSPLDCDDADSCTVDICRFSDGQCESFSLPSCCVEDTDCPVENCQQVYCEPVAQVCTSAAIPGCCETSADCQIPDGCSTASCVQGACVKAVLENCCTEDLQCGDGEPCTQDLCGSDGRCLHVPVVAGLGCSDGDIFTFADQCLPAGRCAGFHRWLMPAVFGRGGVVAATSSYGGFVGFVGENGGETGIWVDYSEAGYPFEPQTLSADRFVDASAAFALTQGGALYGFGEASGGPPFEELSLNSALPGIEVSPWRTMSTWNHEPSKQTHILAGGQGHSVAHCVRVGDSGSWDCLEDAIFDTGAGDVLVLRIRASGEAWALVRNFADETTLYARDVTTPGSAWVPQENPVCSPGESICNDGGLVALALDEDEQAVFVASESASLMRRDMDGEWEDISPQFGGADPAGSGVELRAVSEYDGTLVVAGYERQCLFSASGEGCVLEHGRWWLFMGAVGEGGAVAWSQGVMLLEESCGQGLPRSCPAANEPSGPLSVNVLSEGGSSSAWVITGAIWGEQGPQGVVFWKP